MFSLDHTPTSDSDKSPADYCTLYPLLLPPSLLSSRWLDGTAGNPCQLPQDIFDRTQVIPSGLPAVTVKWPQAEKEKVFLWRK